MKLIKLIAATFLFVLKILYRKRADRQTRAVHWTATVPGHGSHD